LLQDRIDQKRKSAGREWQKVYCSYSAMFMSETNWGGLFIAFAPHLAGITIKKGEPLQPFCGMCPNLQLYGPRILKGV
jgi:hypothetical protein